MAGQSPNFDWSVLSTLLSSSSPIPGDVKFNVMDQEDKVVATLEAHKIILALHSDHFKNAFFGSGTLFKENEDNIVQIKETTKEAFEDYVGFNYEKRIKFEKKNLEELYEILNLAERYQVKELKDRVSDFIKNFPLSIDNVAKVAATACEFPQFAEGSQELYAKCVTFLGTQFTDAQSVLNFVSRNEDEATVVKLLRDVKNPGCPNCQQTPCRNRSSISRKDLLLPGMLIQTGDSGWRQRYKNQLCRVVSAKEGGNVSVTWVNPPTPADIDVGDPYTSHLDYMGFKYVCDK